MKIKSINQSSALICVICGLILLPLTASAKTLYVSNTAASGNGEIYESVTGTTALFVTGSNGSYIGTNITLSSAISIRDGIGSIAAYVMNQGRLDLTGGNITTTGEGGSGIFVYDNSSVMLNSVQFDFGGLDSIGLMAAGSSTLTLVGGNITSTTGDALAGIAALDNSVVTVGGARIEGINGVGVMLQISSTLTLADSAITAGYIGVALDSSSSGTLNNVDITTTLGLDLEVEMGEQFGGVVVTQSSTLALTGGSINTSGSLSHGIFLSPAAVSNPELSGTSRATVTDVNITVTGDDSLALFLGDNSTATVNLDQNTWTGGLHSGTNSALILTGSNGTLLTGDITSTDNSTVNLTLTGNGSKLIGNITQDATSAITLDISDGASFVGSGTVTSLTLENGVTIGYTGDFITVTDSITIDGVVTFDLSDLSEAGPYDLIDWSGAGGNVDVGGADYNFTGAGVEGTFNVVGDKLVFNATAVPEPATCFLLGTSLGVLLLAAHRRRNAHS
jgi:hypothetical protein